MMTQTEISFRDDYAGLFNTATYRHHLDRRDYDAAQRMVEAALTERYELLSADTSSWRVWHYKDFAVSDSTFRPLKVQVLDEHYGKHEAAIRLLNGQVQIVSDRVETMQSVPNVVQKSTFDAEGFLIERLQAERNITRTHHEVLGPISVVSCMLAFVFVGASVMSTPAVSEELSLAPVPTWVWVVSGLLAVNGIVFAMLSLYWWRLYRKLQPYEQLQVLHHRVLGAIQEQYGLRRVEPVDRTIGQGYVWLRGIALSGTAIDPPQVKIMDQDFAVGTFDVRLINGQLTLM